MVRLRVFILLVHVFVLAIFQFQYGAIKRYEYFRAYKYSRFISIPVWCD